MHRIGRPDAVTVTLPAVPASEKVWLTLELEDGDLGRAALGRARAGRPRAVATAGGTRSVVVPIDLAAVAGRPLPPGRHRLTLERAGAPESALVLSAPDCPQAPRWLGAFIPLHAIRGEDDWGIGTYPELGRLGEWVSACGVDVLGTLPLYPAFLEPPADPSPYLPVSRLAYNEIYVDPTALPEFATCDEARQRWGSAAPRAQAAALRSTATRPLRGGGRADPRRARADGRVPAARVQAGTPGGSEGFRATPPRARGLRPLPRPRRAGPNGHRPRPLSRDLPPLLPVGGEGAARCGRPLRSPVRRLSDRLTSSRLRPRMVPGFLHHRRPRWCSTRPLLSRRSGLGVPAPAPAAHPGRRLSLPLGRAGPRLPARGMCPDRPHHGSPATVHDPRGGRRGCLRRLCGRRARRAGGTGSSSSGHGRRGRGSGHGARRAPGPDGTRPHAPHVGVPIRVERGPPAARAARFLPGRPRNPRPASLRGLPLGRGRDRARNSAACSRPTRRQPSRRLVGRGGGGSSAPSACPKTGTSRPSPRRRWKAV